MVNPNDNTNQDQLVVGTMKHFFTVGSISLFGTCANYLLNEAVIHGKAGPSQALVESQSLWMLFLEVFFLHEMPNEMQVVGFVLGLSGGLCIACDLTKKSNH
jgi:drug/metabolite transporter (DMT)-like permease